MPIFIFAAGCSSIRPVNTGREGFLDRLSHLEQPGRESLRHSDDETDRALAQYKGTLGQWRWPLREVSITSEFGERGRGFHEGIDLRAGVGTSVYAVSGGEVLYAGTAISGYGRMIVIRHKNGLLSVYAHLSQAGVKRGQAVKRGQLIAKSGKTGRVSGPHLHFEIRSGTVALNPMKLLPDGERYAQGATDEPRHLAFQ